MTGRRLPTEIVERIFVLKSRDHLTHTLIAQRLGLHVDTVKRYIAKFRTEGRLDGHVLQTVRKLE